MIRKKEDFFSQIVPQIVVYALSSYVVIRVCFSFDTQTWTFQAINFIQIRFSNIFWWKQIYFFENPIVNASKSKPVLPSAAQTKNSKGMKFCTRIVLALVGARKFFHSPPSSVTSSIKEMQLTGFTVVIWIMIEFMAWYLEPQILFLRKIMLFQQLN